MQYLDAISKTKEWSLFVSKANHSISQLSKSVPQPVTLKKLKWMVLWRPTRPFRTPKKDVLFFKGDWNAKVGSQETPGVTGKFGLGMRTEAGQRLIEFCRENALVIANPLFQQHKRRLYTWTSPDGQQRNHIDYILSRQRWTSSIQSAKTRPGADCGSDQELLIAKFRLKLNKVGKTTRPFRYDLNQIPYDYTVEVRNRFKGLDLIDRLPDELWTEVCDIVQETGIKTIPMEKKSKKKKKNCPCPMVNSPPESITQLSRILTHVMCLLSYVSLH